MYTQNTKERELQQMYEVLLMEQVPSGLFYINVSFFMADKAIGTAFISFHGAAISTLDGGLLMEVTSTNSGINNVSVVFLQPGSTTSVILVIAVPITVQSYLPLSSNTWNWL